MFGLIDARKSWLAQPPVVDHAVADHLGRHQHVDRRPADHLGRSDFNPRVADLWGDQIFNPAGQQIIWGDQVYNPSGQQIIWGDQIDLWGEQILWGDQTPPVSRSSGVTAHQEVQ